MIFIFIGTVALALLLTSGLGLAAFALHENFFFDFTVSLLTASMHTLFIMIGFLFELSNQLVSIFMACLPSLLKLIIMMTSFLIWVVKQVLKGIFGTGNVFLSAVSWVFCFCLFCFCILSTERFFSNSTSNEVDDNNRNTIREVNRRMEHENHENENEENRMEEAEINMAAEDNDRNAVREIEHRRSKRKSPQKETAAAVFQGERLVVRLPKRRGLHRKAINYIQIQDEGTESEISDTETDSSNDSSETEVVDVNDGNSVSRSRNTTVVRRKHTRDDVEDTICVVCFDRRRNAALFPCGHLQLCIQCVESIMTRTKCCPTCQSDIQEYRKVYL
jgi:hypothetical protein